MFGPKARRESLKIPQALLIKKETTIERIKKYKAIAKKLGFKRDAEDIASEAYADFLKHPDRKQTDGQRVIDAVRVLFGRGDKTNRKIPSRSFSIEEEGYIEKGKSNPFGQGEALDIDKKLASLDADERVMFLLRHLWGFNIHEVGYCFGMSGSRISQRMTEIEKKVVIDHPTAGRRVIKTTH